MRLCSRLVSGNTILSGCTSFNSLFSSPSFPRLAFSDYHRRWYTNTPHTTQVATNQNSPASLSLPPSIFAMLGENWIPHKRALKRDLTSRPIPRTCDWTIDELLFFKLHYHQVIDSALWHTIFCCDAPLTERGKGIINLQLDMRHLIGGNFVTPDQHFFASLLHVMWAEGKNDLTHDLVMYLLHTCNPDTTVLHPRPRLKETLTKVGMQSFASNSNATVAILIPSLSLEVASVIVMIDEDGDLQSSPNLEYQLPGEMLAAASRNYYETGRRFPQTIFALRVIGTDMTIYRADFPVHYLQSIDRGAPVDHITIFRLGGIHHTDDPGMSIMEERAEVVQWICNVMNTCKQIGLSLRYNQIPGITEERIALLYPKAIEKEKKKDERRKKKEKRRKKGDEKVVD